MRNITRSNVFHAGLGDYLCEHDLKLQYNGQSTLQITLRRTEQMWGAVKEIGEDMSYKSKTEEEYIVQNDRRAHVEHIPRDDEPAPSEPASWEKSGAGDGHQCVQSSSHSCQNLIGMLAPARLEVEALLEQGCQQVIGTCPSNAKWVQVRVDSVWEDLQRWLRHSASADGKAKQMEMEGARAMDEANTAHAR